MAPIAGSQTPSPLILPLTGDAGLGRISSMVKQATPTAPVTVTETSGWFGMSLT
jgi:hypothetical protein